MMSNLTQRVLVDASFDIYYQSHGLLVFTALFISMRKSCDVTDVVKTFRKHTKACPIDLMNFDWNQNAIPAGISGFAECFDDLCDVTRFPHWIAQLLLSSSRFKRFMTSNRALMSSNRALIITWSSNVMDQGL